MKIKTEGRYYPSREDLPPEKLEMLERIAFEEGESFDSYLVIETGREYFLAEGVTGGVAFARKGKYLLVGGGLLAAPEARSELLAEFRDWARDHRLHILFINVYRHELAIFRNAGFRLTKCGEDPVVVLRETTWRGKAYEWLRRQENFCVRQQVHFEEIAIAPENARYRDETAPRLQHISQTHLEHGLHGSEWKHFVGQFDPLDLGRRRLFAARRDGEIVAYLVCNPALNGRMWAAENYRRLPDAPRGVIPFLMMQTMRQLQEEEVDYFSLSLIPGVRCDAQLKGDSWRFRWLMYFWWRKMNWVFDMQGIYHYKSRFRPHYRESYVAACPDVTWGSLFAMSSTWGMLDVNPLRLVQWSLKKWKKGGRRTTLANPPWRPERVIRDLRTYTPDAGRATKANPAQLESEPTAR